MIGSLLAALVAGLVGSPHCLGMCGAFAAAAGRPAAGGRRARLVVLGARSGAWLWHAGRLSTYATLGILAGAVGAVLPGPRWVPAALSATLLLWFAASLAGVVPAAGARVPGLARVSGRVARQDGLVWRYLFGAATGVLPCGLVYAGLSLAVAAATPLEGALVMLAFGLGTVPALALLSTVVRRLALGTVAGRRVLAVLVLVAGLWSLAMRTAMPSGGRHGAHDMHAAPTAPAAGGHAPAHAGQAAGRQEPAAAPTSRAAGPGTSPAASR